MTLALADELFLIAHDLQTGKPRLSEPALGIGLSAALLAELVFSGALVVADGQITIGDYAPPAERLSETLFERTRQQLHSEALSVRDWLATHRRQTTELVADRMVRAGEIRREETRRLGRRIVRFYPLRPAEAFIRTQRLSSYLRMRSEISAGDGVLAALATIISPGRSLLEIDDADHEYLQQLIPLLPIPLRELLSITDSSIVAGLRSPHV